MSHRFAQAVREHWAIANSLHWTLDVSFNEDPCRIRTGYAANNLAHPRHLTLTLTLNLLRYDTQKRRGIKGKQKSAA